MNLRNLVPIGDPVIVACPYKFSVQEMTAIRTKQLLADTDFKRRVIALEIARMLIDRDMIEFKTTNHADGSATLWGALAVSRVVERET